MLPSMVAQPVLLLPPNSVMKPLRLFCFSQAVTAARLVAASLVQAEWPPEKSLSRYSWMSTARFLAGSTSFPIQLLEASAPPSVQAWPPVQELPGVMIMFLAPLARMPSMAAWRLALSRDEDMSCG